MPSVPITNLNAYANLDEAQDYLDDSVRGASWESLDPDTQSRALLTARRLLDRQLWEGDPTGLQVVESAVVADDGSGYAAGDILTIAGGATEDPARVEVTSVDGTGQITGVQLIDAGGYSTAPSSPNTPTGGSGSGAQLTLVLVDQVCAHPRTGMTDGYEDAVDDGFVAAAIVQASIELAYLLSRDPTLEGQGSTAQNSIKKTKAGTAEVEFFAPGAFVPITRFPPEVMELIAPFLLGSGSASGSEDFGTGDASEFDDCAVYGLEEGLP